MLNDVLGFLKDRLNAHYKLGGKADDAREDQVVFPVGQSIDTLNFKLGAVSALVVNLDSRLGAVPLPPLLHGHAEPAPANLWHGDIAVVAANGWLGTL